MNIEHLEKEISIVNALISSIEERYHVVLHVKRDEGLDFQGIRWYYDDRPKEST